MVGNILVIAFPSIAILGAFALFYLKPQDPDVEAACGVFMVISIIATVAMTVVWMSTYAGQVGDIAKVEEHHARIANSEQQLEDISAVLLRELTAYPEFEKEAYESFMENGGDVGFLFKYPELRSNAVVIESAEQHSAAIREIYEEKQELERTLRNIQTRQSNALLPKFGLPRYDHSS